MPELRCPSCHAYRRCAPRLTLLLTVLSSSLLAGCAVGPDYEQPALHIPDKWSNADSHNTQLPAQLSQWWARLSDPLLNALVSQAVEASLPVEMAKARVREARALLRDEAANLIPAGDGVASANRSRTAAGDSIPASTSSEFRAGFDASWEIDLFGRYRRSVEGAQYGLEAAEEDLRNTMLVLIGDVALNYCLARAYQARAALARRAARSQRELARLTRSKYDTGTATTADVANAEALAAATEADVPSFEIVAARAVHRLGVLLGQPPSALIAQMRNGRPIPQPKLPLPVGIPADVLLTRPDVRMAERQLARAHGEDRRGGSCALSLRQPDRQHRDRGVEHRRSRKEVIARLGDRPDADRPDFASRAAQGRGRCRTGAPRCVLCQLSAVGSDCDGGCRERDRISLAAAYPQRQTIISCRLLSNSGERRPDPVRVPDPPLISSSWTRSERFTPPKVI